MENQSIFKKENKSKNKNKTIKQDDNPEASFCLIYESEALSYVWAKVNKTCIFTFVLSFNCKYNEGFS